jgi:DNA-binding HxlR family transcriptional regulator
MTSPPGPLDRSLDRAVARLGDRWTLLIVDALLGGPRRFGELSDHLSIAPNILTRRLRELEADGLIVSAPYSQRPPRFSYELTAVGRELAGAIEALAAWGARRDGRDDGRVHATCGSPLEVRRWCPTCDRVVDEGDEDGLLWV